MYISNFISFFFLLDKPLRILAASTKLLHLSLSRKSSSPINRSLSCARYIFKYQIFYEPAVGSPHLSCSLQPFGLSNIFNTGSIISLFQSCIFPPFVAIHSCIPCRSIDLSFKYQSFFVVDHISQTYMTTIGMKYCPLYPNTLLVKFILHYYLNILTIINVLILRYYTFINYYNINLVGLLCL